MNREQSVKRLFLIAWTVYTTLLRCRTRVEWIVRPMLIIVFYIHHAPLTTMITPVKSLRRDNVEKKILASQNRRWEVRSKILLWVKLTWNKNNKAVIFSTETQLKCFRLEYSNMHEFDGWNKLIKWYFFQLVAAVHFQNFLTTGRSVKFHSSLSIFANRV